MTNSPEFESARATTEGELDQTPRPKTGMIASGEGQSAEGTGTGTGRAPPGDCMRCG